MESCCHQDRDLAGHRSLGNRRQDGRDECPRFDMAFKIKRFTDGLIKKFKARFCVSGDQQIEGINFFKTYAPVVQWTTVRLMLILEVLLDLKSKQGNITAAFLHVDLGEGEDVYVKMRRGFEKMARY